MPSLRLPVSRRRRPLLGAAHDGDFRAPHSHFWCDAADGVRLAGTMLGDPSSTTGVVLAHGFMGYRRKMKNRFLAETLAQRFRVFAFDMRGHGESGGACTGGAIEQLDVEAVVAAARRRGLERIVTVGWSLGGIAVVRHAAQFGGVDGVVAISTPARWTSESKAVRRTTWLFTSPVGRALANRVMHTRIDLRTDMPEPPVEAVRRIAAPILIVHGANDHFFGVDAATELYAAAVEPKQLMIREGFGHAEDGFTPDFAAELADAIVAFSARV
ncbi:MAG TPA: alpha/beta fold hydrolase [Actinomycetota bacterium]